MTLHECLTHLTQMVSSLRFFEYTDYLEYATGNANTPFKLRHHCTFEREWVFECLLEALPVRLRFLQNTGDNAKSATESQGIQPAWQLTPSCQHKGRLSASNDSQDVEEDLVDENKLQPPPQDLLRR
jgi:hypothetical protein